MSRNKKKMENELNKIEKEIQKISKGYQPNVDLKNLWDNIEGGLPIQKKKSRRAFIWLPFGAIGIFALIFIYKWNNYPTNIGIDATQKENIIVAESNLSNGELFDEDNQSEILNKTNDEVIIAPTRKVEKSIKVALNANHQDPINSHMNAVREVESSKSETHENLNNINENITDAFSVEIEGEKLREMINSSINLNTDKVFDERSTVFIAKASRLQTKILKNEVLLSLEQPIIPVEKPKWNWIYGSRIGANKNISQHKTLSSGEPDRRFDLEKDAYGWNLDLLFGKKNQNGFYWSSGIGYNVANTVFQQKELNPTTTLVKGVVTTKIDDAGTTSDVEGDLIKTTLNRIDVNWHRKHENYSLIGAVGKEFLRLDNFSVSGEFGVRLNFVSLNGGYHFEKDELSLTKTTKSNSTYNDGVSFHSAYSLPIKYSFNQNIEMVIIPYFHLSHANIINNNTFYQLKNSQCGIQLGIVYQPH